MIGRTTHVQLGITSTGFCSATIEQNQPNLNTFCRNLHTTDCKLFSTNEKAELIDCIQSALNSLIYYHHSISRCNTLTSKVICTVGLPLPANEAQSLLRLLGSVVNGPLAVSIPCSTKAKERERARCEASFLFQQIPSLGGEQW